jgi:enterochelin esterase-like enzyme
VCIGQVAVYVPPSYETASQKRYPTLYLLHGFTGKITEWTRHGYQGMSLQSVMDGLIKSSAIGEMIVVASTGAKAYAPYKCRF